MRSKGALTVAALAIFSCSIQSTLAGDANLYEPESIHDGLDQHGLKGLCPDYTEYALHNHTPHSTGPLHLPYQRLDPLCRKFASSAVEKVIEDLLPKFKDADLAHIFRNAYPNTLDTTVRWHKAGGEDKAIGQVQKWDGAQSFIVTGDINALWLRDSTNQLAPYQGLAASSEEISNLIRGAINTQTEYVIESPYCNAFQPPPPSNLSPANELWHDEVTPKYSNGTVFECKYELDSLAHYLALSNQYFVSTKDTSFLTARWFEGLSAVLAVLDAQSMPTFNPESHVLNGNEYTFMRTAKSGTETLILDGLGNPLAAGTSLVRSAFRPSDDATIFGFLIPSNAMMSVELQRTSDILSHYIEAAKLSKTEKKRIVELSKNLAQRSAAIRKGIFEHGVVKTKAHGEIFAFEIDGFGSSLLMDDANIPSLLSLPQLGFVNTTNEIYQNTRKFVLSHSNPYFLSGKAFSGIGGPHIGLRNAWPMAVLTQAITSDNDEEIMDCLERVKNVSPFGLINESVDVDKGVRADGKGEGLTRPWFAWANAVFSSAILDLAERKPHLIFANNTTYIIGRGFV